MSKFQFSACVDFEIDSEKAAHLLSDPQPNLAVIDYMAEQHCAVPRAKLGPYVGTHIADELRKALGAHLAERKIDECKQLALPADGGEQ